MQNMDPLTVSHCSETSPSHRIVFSHLRALAIPVILFLVGLTIDYRLALLRHVADVSRERDRVVLQIDQIRNTLSRELYANINLTQGLVDLVRVQKGIQPAQFEAMARELKGHSGLIHNFVLAPDNVVRYVYPLQGNEKVLGLDYRDAPDQLAAVQRAMTEKRLVVAGPLHLVQGGVGIVGRMPIFVQDSVDGQTKQRYWGVASTVIDFDTLMALAGFDQIGSRLSVVLRGIDGTGSRGGVFWGSDSLFRHDPVTLDIALPVGSWQIAALPARGWPRFQPLTSGPFLAGLVLVLILAVLVYQISRTSQGRAHEIRQRRITEDALRQKNRALRLFSQCNSAVVHAADEQALLTELCRIAVEVAGYRMAWVGRAEHDEARTVRPVTWAGSAEGFLDNIYVSWGDNPHGYGTAGIAIRSGRPAIGRDLLNNKDFAVWHDVFAERDYAAVIAVPLIVGDAVFGVLLIYAAEPDAFDSTEVSLLEDLGINISHGIMAIRSKKERDETMAALEAARNELEIRVAQRTRELLSAKEAAESADRLKSAFLATMSHELRTPLNSIIGFTGIILQGLVGDITEEQRKQLGMVRDSANHLLALINDVLDISKIEAGQLEIRKEVFPIQQAISRTVQVVRPLAEKKSLTLRCDIDQSPLLLYSDLRRVEQVLINLLNNAVKFTDVGSVTISMSRARETQIIKDDSRNRMGDVCVLRITIRDTGIGIKAEDMDKLFKPFRQIDIGTTRRYEGTGLGLSICKKLAVMLDGDIQAQSDGVGKGATFIFTLPLGGNEHGQNPCHRG
jgi:signal transduction histidine kinase/sensor domain CHASE-containing protein